MTEKLYKRTEVEALTGLSRTTIYEMMKDGSFPRPLRVSKRAVRWQESTLTNWIESQPTASS